MKRISLLGLAALVVVAVLVWFSQAREPADPAGPQRDLTEVTTDDDGERRRGNEVDTEPVRPERKQRERADEIRAAIRALANANDAARPVDDPVEVAASGPRDDDANESGLRDRLGLPEATKRAFAQDLMPLVDECIELAHAREPGLEGLLAVELGIAAEEELGAVVDTVEFPERNELGDPEVLECIRETALSLSLPASDHGGREDVLLTIPVTPEAAEPPP